MIFEKIMKSLPGLNESISQYVKRSRYAIARRIIPSVRESHRLDSLVGPRGHWDQLQQYQQNFLIRMGLKHDHTLLDVGCGPLQGGLAFIKYLEPAKYVGLDIRHEPLTAGYELITRHGLVHKNPRLLMSEDFGKSQLNGQTFDYIWATQILYHLDEKQITEFFERMAHRMHRDSVLYGDIIGHPNKVNPSSHWNKFRFHLHDFDFMQDTAAKFDLEMTHLGRIEEFGYPEKIALKTNDMLQFRKAD